MLRGDNLAVDINQWKSFKRISCCMIKDHNEVVILGKVLCIQSNPKETAHLRVLWKYFVTLSKGV